MTEHEPITKNSGPDRPWFAQAVSGNDLFADPGPQPELFEELIPGDCVMLLGGPGGVGKTTLAMMMAICLIARRCLFGEFQPSTFGHVIFYMGEDSTASACRLFQRVAEAMNLTPDERKEISKFLHPVPLAGVTGKLTRTQGNGRLEIAPDVQKLCDYSKSRFDPLAAVVFDPILRFHAGEESTNEHGDVLIQAANQIVLTLKTTVLLLSHTTKESRNVGLKHNPGTAFRGASSIYDGVRHAILLSPEKERVVLTTAKCNLSRPIRPLELIRGSSGVLRIANNLDEKKKRMMDLEILVLERIESEQAAGRSYTKHKFVSKFSGANGPLRAGKHRVDEAIKNLLGKDTIKLGDKGRLESPGFPAP